METMPAKCILPKPFGGIQIKKTEPGVVRFTWDRNGLQVETVMPLSHFFMLKTEKFYSQKI